MSIYCPCDGTNRSGIELDATFTAVFGTDPHSVTDGAAISFWMKGGWDNPGVPAGAMVCGTNTHYIYLADELRARCYNGSYNDWTADVDFYDKWRHVVLQFWDNGYGIRGHLYLDGVQQAMRYPGHDIDFDIDYIGTAYTNRAYDFRGRLANFAVYDRKLTQAEIDLLYANGNIVPRMPLVVAPGHLDLFFPMDAVEHDVDLSGPAYDMSGNGRDGTWISVASPAVGKAELNHTLHGAPLMVQTGATPLSPVYPSSGVINNGNYWFATVSDNDWSATVSRSLR